MTQKWNRLQHNTNIFYLGKNFLFQIFHFRVKFKSVVSGATSGKTVQQILAEQEEAKRKAEEEAEKKRQVEIARRSQIAQNLAKMVKQSIIFQISCNYKESFNN